MRKKAHELKKGDIIIVAGEKLKIETVEISEVGKQGSQKCRIEAVKENKERVAIIRPADYPFTTEE